jgi:hypothetical protein
MNEQNNGGPAFPQHEHDPNCVLFCCYGLQDSLSIRDWFAGKEKSYPPTSWIQSIYGSELNGWHDLKGIDLIDALCRWRYQCADAMLKTRENA